MIKREYGIPYKCTKHCKIDVEYQPIINLSTGEIYAYEGLARFQQYNQSLPPEKVFKSLLHNPKEYHKLEIKVKLLQIKHRPIGIRLFLNIDPLMCTSNKKILFWSDFFKKQDNVTMEIIESKSKQALINSKEIYKVAEAFGVNFALDDVLSSGSLHCMELFSSIDTVKIDRNIFLKAQSCDKKKEILVNFIEMCLSLGKTVIQEGIETSEQLLFAREYKVTHVQGYLYRDLFEYKRSLVP